MRVPKPSRPANRPAIVAGAAVLAILTVLGTAPSPDEDAGVATGGATPEPMRVETMATPEGEQSMTFQQLFEEMRTPEASGEGQGTVVVAAAPSPGATPDPVAPSTGAPVPVTLPEVEAVMPSLSVAGLSADEVATIRAIDGVQAAAAATVMQVDLQPPGGPQTVTVAAVDPTDFRPLTPGITANEPGVWQRIIAGDAAFNHDAGNRLTAPLGTSVPTSDGDGLRIGAYASNGIPPVADALISTDRAAALGLTGDATVYVALAEGADEGAVTAAITAAGGQVTAIEPPEEQQAFLTGSAAADFFEPFNYVDHGDGLITIDPDWVARNIETRRLPIFTGDVTCHKQMLIQLEGALAEVEANGLAPLIDTTDYGGCWVARHIDWRPDRPISMHGWGLAVDFNVRTNGLGQQPTMDPRIVEIFDRWGFVWGGRWSRPDGMHFEIGAVLQAPPLGAAGTLGQ